MGAFTMLQLEVRSSQFLWREPVRTCRYTKQKTERKLSHLRGDNQKIRRSNPLLSYIRIPNLIATKLITGLQHVL